MISLMNTRHCFPAISCLIALGLVGCQSAPTRIPAPPAQPQLISAAPLSIEDSCRVDGAVLVEYTVLRNGQTANVDLASAPDCARDALTAWVNSYRYAPQRADVSARFEWILVSAKRGS
jgi:hypothetical protein